MSSDLRASENPRTWRFTWEAISHKPTLKLFLFDSYTKPSEHCKNVTVDLNLEQSVLLVGWIEHNQVLLRVPIPRVLVDAESPVSVRALEDHIEVKLPLLLPVNHPIVSGFDSLLNECEDKSHQEDVFSKEARPLLMDYDLKNLSSEKGVHFYCRRCSAKLTRRPLTVFSEMPSVNWREAADNWFGACCCSFGGISEKLVISYANLYKCKEGACLLSTTSVVLCKNDLLGCKFTDWDRNGEDDSKPRVRWDDMPFEATQDSGNNHGRVACCENQKKNMRDIMQKTSFMNLKTESRAVKCKVTEKEVTADDLFCEFTAVSGCCSGMANHVRDHDACIHDVSTSLNGQESNKNIKLLENQKHFLSGFLGNAFMASSSNVSKDVNWVEFVCPQCSFLLGAFPFFSGDASSDGGVQLFKCSISTCSPVGKAGDIFWNYTLERMFANQLLESAEDELSFRTVICDLKTKCPMIQLVLLNADSWCCSGYCTEGTIESTSAVNMQPVIKVLFSDCSNNVESQSRLMEEWLAKNLADEVYMFAHQIKEMIASLESARDLYPTSFVFLQGLSLSHIQR